MTPKAKKTGVLLVIIVAPVLFFFAMKWFGWVETAVSLPYYIPKDIEERREGDSIFYDTTYHQVPPFSFYNENGETITQGAVEGKIRVVDFIFTRCQVECPLMTSQLLRVNEIFQNDSNIAFLSHTVDPQHDSPAVLKTYKESFGITNEQWYFLTGSKDEIYEQALKGYYLAAGEEDTEVGFLHSDKIVLVDKEGFIRGFYSGTDPEDIDRLKTEISVLKMTYD